MLDDELISILRSHGRRVTSQRLLVHRIVRSRDTHLTAEQVHEAVRRELPATSLPTIYATLELLRGLGVVRRVSVPSRGALYEGRTDPHAHAVCRLCGSVRDIEAVELRPAMTAAQAVGFTPEHADAVVSGVCRRCR